MSLRPSDFKLVDHPVGTTQQLSTAQLSTKIGEEFDGERWGFRGKHEKLLSAQCVADEIVVGDDRGGAWARIENGEFAKTVPGANVTSRKSRPAV